MKHVVVAGATGLVGMEILRELHTRDEITITALVRQKGRVGRISERIQEVLFDYDQPASYERLGSEIPCDVLLCALGTTMKQAGSKEAFRKVDRDYPMAMMYRLVTLDPHPVFGAVSSIGAGHPRGFYLRTKAEMEKALFESGLPYVIVRPGLLLGDRREFRLAERLGVWLVAKPYLAVAKVVAPQSRLVWKYAPIEAAEVAKALVRSCVDNPPTLANKVISGLALHHPILGME